MPAKVLFLQIIFILSAILPCPTYAQISQGTITVGGAGSDIGTSVVQTSDGGFALAGYTASFGSGNDDLYVAKLNNAGALQWTRTIGGANTDYGSSIIQTSDGGYAITGQSNSYCCGAWNGLLTKLDAMGNVSWSNYIGGFGSDFFNDIIQTTDGGYALVGNSDTYGPTFSNNVYITKLTAAGGIVWSLSIGQDGTGDEYGYSIIQTSDGGYAVSGMTTGYGSGSWDVYVIRLNNAGAVLWTRTIGGSGDDRSYSIIQTSDGGFAIAGHTPSFGAGLTDAYLIKLDASGSVLWNKTLGGLANDYARSVVETPDGGLLVAGYTSSFGAGANDVYLFKVNNAGTLLWTKTAGTTGNDLGTSLVLTSDGGFAMNGYTNSGTAGSYDMCLYKFDINGDICLSVSSGGIEGSGGTFSSGGLISSGFFSSAAGTFSNGGVTINQCLTLPIELISLQAKCDSDNTKITWITATETNNDFFTIEESDNTIDWNVAGTVDGFGNSSDLRHYEFIAGNSGSSLTYFRLKQTSFDGSSEYSEIISSDCEGMENFLTVYPNPSSREITVKANIQIKEVSIWSLSGELLCNQPANGTKITFNLPEVCEGLYTARILTTNGYEYKKIVLGN